MKIKIHLLTVFALLTYASLQAQTFVVDNTYSYEDLIVDILLQNTECASVENVVGWGGLENSAPQSIGYFQNFHPDFDMEDGIVLATGDVMNVPGPQVPGFAGDNVTLDFSAWPGDPELFAYMQSTGIDPFLNSHNKASYIEFDFTSFTDSISFNFIFASNEYGTYQCDFSDAFAFFLEDQSTGVVTNMAVLKDNDGNVIPGPTFPEIPISVLTIRDACYDESFIGCSSENPQFFGQYYGDSSPCPSAFPNSQAPVNFDGMTIKMQAWSYVTPFQTYRMKMVVADRNDTAVSSAVFLEGGSFFFGEVDLGDDIAFDSEDSDCLGSPIALEIDEFPDCDYFWYFENDPNPIPGADSNVYMATESGLYTVSVDCGAGSCDISDSIYVEFRVTPDLSPNWDDTTVSFCEYPFTHTLVATPDNITDLHEITYTWYHEGIQLGHNLSTMEVTEPGTYTVIVDEHGCSSMGHITIELMQEFEVDLGDDIEDCGESEYEITATLTSNDPIDYNDVTYDWNTGETTASILVTESGIYEVDVTYQGCTKTEEVYVEVGVLPEIVFDPESLPKCPNDEIVLTAHIVNAAELSNNVTYIWLMGTVEVGSGSPELVVTDFGIYTLVVDNDGCENRADVEVTEYQGNSSCVITQGLSPGGSFGDNDEMDLTFLSDRTGIAKFQVFNRYGSLVYNQSDYVNQWVGQSNDNADLPTGTYYYVINFSGDDPVYGTQHNGWVYINRDAN